MPSLSKNNTGDVPASNKQRPLALVVDDERINRLKLETLLRANGYDVVHANDGIEAVALAESEDPDIIFMDVMMPHMDGYEAVTQIRKKEPNKFIPIIFLTALSSENALAKCIQVGGDDFMTKPYSHIVLEAKIQSLERIRGLNNELSRLYGQMRCDQEIAETVFNGAVIADNVELKGVETLLKPAELFSGDVFLTAQAPANNTHIMLGDFTGHGLSAALGALPASEVFRAMTAKGFSPHQIIAGINNKLHRLLPTGMFCALQFVSISNDLKSVAVCNCGMPDILLIDGKSGAIKKRFSSTSFPLGIAPDLDFQEKVVLANIDEGDRILLVSDGVAEARDPESNYYGQERFENAIKQRKPGESTLQSITRSLSSFCKDAPQDDDISLAEIPLTPEILPNWKNEEARSVQPTKQTTVTPPPPVPLDDALELSIMLPANRLRQADPVPQIVNHIQEMEEIQGHRRHLFTLLTELYVNALDHGILQLDSEIKNAPDGFTEYFAERERRLRELTQGFIKIRIQTRSTAQGGTIRIRLEDSGQGFDYEAYRTAEAPDHQKLSGRGLHLLHSLCESVTYEAPGNKVEVVFNWER
jgi:CheY-like chemotaxis protein